MDMISGLRYAAQKKKEEEEAAARKAAAEAEGTVAETDAGGDGPATTHKSTDS
jgi:hypothetical protein